jgi:hypothetical protein
MSEFGSGPRAEHAEHPEGRDPEGRSEGRLPWGARARRRWDLDRGGRRWHADEQVFGPE